MRHQRCIWDILDTDFWTQNLIIWIGKTCHTYVELATKTLDPHHESCFQTTNVSKLSEQYRSKIKDLKHQTLRKPFPDAFFCMKMVQGSHHWPARFVTRLRIRIDHVHEALRKHQTWQPLIIRYISRFWVISWVTPLSSSTKPIMKNTPGSLLSCLRAKNMLEIHLLTFDHRENRCTLGMLP